MKVSASRIHFNYFRRKYHNSAFCIQHFTFPRLPDAVRVFPFQEGDCFRGENRPCRCPTGAAQDDPLGRHRFFCNHCHFRCHIPGVGRGDGRQQYIHYNKEQHKYLWVYQPKGYYNLPVKIEWIKKHNLWQQVRDNYIDKKNTNADDNKKSRSIFAETIHQVCQQNGYYR